MLKIALDFDDTITAAPEYFSAMVMVGKLHDKEFYCVTSRRDTDENNKYVKEFLDKFKINIPIIFCNLKAKTKVTKERGINIDIWIDNNPKYILNDY